MDMDPAPSEHLYEMFQDDAPELLGMLKGSDSPVTARENSPWHTGRILQGPRGQQTDHQIFGPSYWS